VAPYNILGHVPDEEEIISILPRLKNSKATGPSGMKAEHIKEWYYEAYPHQRPRMNRTSFDEGPSEEDEATRNATPNPENWNLLVSTVQHMLHTGDIPTRASWAYRAVIPKPQGGSRGIGLLEILWKLVEAIIDQRVNKTAKFHDILHGFRNHRGTGTSIIEAKLQQELTHLQGKPLFQVFLDLSKAYDTLHRGRSLSTLQAYGMGPCLIRLIKHN
jgi:Reverse transcriptase (RNA-dependent DNA polymerase)